MKKVVLFLLGLLFCSFFVSAELVVNPISNNVPVYKGVSKVFSVELWNNNSFPVYNVSFSSVSGFSFPVVLGLFPGERRNISYSVLEDSVFSAGFVSTVSFMYDVSFNRTPQTFTINVSNESFVPGGLSLLSNDSIIWYNFRNESIIIKDLGGSGFPWVTVAPLSYSTVKYDVPANYSFYCTPGLGFTGGLNISIPSGSGVGHDSSFDVPVVFNVVSTLSPSAVVVQSFPTNFSLNNNQSGVGVLNIRNGENVFLSAVNLSCEPDWCVFGSNGFSLDGFANKIIPYNVTPLVDKTNMTNKSYNLVISAVSSNSLRSEVVVPVFLAYKDFGELVIGGNNYTLTMLGVTYTIEACIQHFGEVGFEDCQRLKDFFTVNRTVIQEVNKSYKFSEAEVAAIKSASGLVGDVSTRTENSVVRVFTKLDDLIAKIDVNVTNAIVDDNARDAEWKANYDSRLDSQNLRFWVVFIILFLVAVLFVVVWVLVNINFCERLIMAGQL